MRNLPFPPSTADARGRLPINEPHASFFQLLLEDQARLLVPVPGPFEGSPVTAYDIQRAAKDALRRLSEDPILGMSSGGKIVTLNMSGRYLITGRYHQAVADLLEFTYPGLVHHSVKSMREHLDAMREQSELDGEYLDHIEELETEYEYTDLPGGPPAHSPRKHMYDAPMLVGGDPNPEWKQVDFNPSEIADLSYPELAFIADHHHRSQGHEVWGPPKTIIDRDGGHLQFLPMPYVNDHPAVQIVHGIRACDEVTAEALGGRYTRIDATRRDGVTLTSARYPDGIFVRRNLDQLARDMQSATRNSPQGDEK